MTRVLPGVYVTFHDYSTLPEGETNLTVGYVLASPRGTVNKAELVTSPTDFLSRYTFSGSPTIKDDKTFWSILQVLKYTNQVYVVRCAKDVLYGGLVVSKTGATAFTEGIEDPENYEFGENDLFVLSGIDGGSYNNNIGIAITSYLDKEGAEDATNKALLRDQFEDEAAMLAAQPFYITVYDTTTNEQLEEFLVSRLANAKAFDGTPMYIETVLEGSAYIKVVNNEDVEGYPVSVAKLNMAGGSEKATSELTPEDAVAALEALEDKTIPVSLIGNGAGTLYENSVYQQALIALAEERKDCMVFLNSRLTDEKATFNSKKASNVVSYKKQDLGSTSYYACMYAPHTKYSDVFNSRQVVIGADSTAIAGWLNVILNSGYPYAYAGPADGLVSGVTTDWKIGDTSGEATSLNDASVNYIAYDAKQGRYYMQCQNTLQIANSSLRNIGAVLNVLDIKETFITYFKEYLQKPITDRLREEILTKGTDYMENDILGTGRCINYTFTDATTDTDLSDNTLRYILAIALTPYAQKIYLTMNIVNANYDFTITQG